MGKNKPLWNPLQNAGKVDSVERKLRGLDEFCHVCKQKGHPWRQCPKLKKVNDNKGSPLKNFQKIISNLKYCVLCFTQGHEENECQKNKKIIEEEVYNKKAKQKDEDEIEFFRKKHDSVIVEQLRTFNETRKFFKSFKKKNNNRTTTKEIKTGKKNKSIASFFFPSNSSSSAKKQVIHSSPFPLGLLGLPYESTSTVSNCEEEI